MVQPLTEEVPEEELTGGREVLPNVVTELHVTGRYPR